MPALVNSSVGSFAGRSGLERTRVCPCRSKYCKNFSRISLPVMICWSLACGTTARKTTFRKTRWRPNFPLRLPIHFAPLREMNLSMVIFHAKALRKYLSRKENQIEALPQTRTNCSLTVLTHRIDLSYKTDTSNEANIMHTLGRYSIGIILISCALFTACSRRSEPVGPRFSGRLLLLAGENTNGADLFELSAAPTGSTYNYSIVTSGVFEAAASPDRTRLLYTTKDGILLRDLRTGAVKPLVKGENYCLAWSPDGNRFSYKQKSPANEKASIGEAGVPPKLYVSDLDGKAKLIWEDLFADSGTGQSQETERAAGSSGCAQWIAPDRLIFDRFLGASPKQKTG